MSLKKSNIYDTKSLIGQNINSFELPSIDNVSQITHFDLTKNKYTLINFWASWCAPCRDEHKYLILLKKNYNLKILGINFKDKKINASKFLINLGNPYFFVASDKKGRSSVDFGVYGIPESILINNKLEILKKFIGPLNQDDKEQIIKIIK